MKPDINNNRRYVYWLLTILIVVGSIEIGARIIERIDNSAARRKNPFVESINPVPAFKIVDMGGIKTVVRSGFHPLMNPELRPFLLERPKGGLRIFLLGGSAAAGWPYHGGNTSISALLERKLKMLYPGRSVEVINVAAGTYGSHRVEMIHDEVLHYNPDAIFLYNGNNEFLEGLVYQPLHPPEPFDRSALVRLVYRLMVPRPRIDVKNFTLDAQVPNTLAFAFARSSLYREDPRQFQMLLKHYKFNVENMVEDSAAAKVPMFLLTCPVNLKDWTPNVSRHRKGMTSEEMTRWTKLFREGELAVERGDYAAAIAPLKAAIAIDDEYAEAHYHLGRSLLRNGLQNEAKVEYVRALERDGFPFRELPEFQTILREIARKNNVPLVDIVAPLEAVSGDGIIGLDTLVDYVHLTEKSQEIVAQEMLKALHGYGLLPEVSLAAVEHARIPIEKKFSALRDVYAADLNYNMAMTMHQYERIDILYEEAINNFTRAAKEDPSLAEDCRNRILLYKEIHPVVQAYRDLLHADKFGLREKNYTAGEPERIFSMYRDMIHRVKTPGLSNEEFDKKIPKVQPQ